MILLIEPPLSIPKSTLKRRRPTAQPPLGLAYLAAVLERSGYAVAILDTIIEDPDCRIGTEIAGEKIRFGLSDEAICAHLEKIRPQIVGVSCLVNAKLEDARRVCQVVKSWNPSCVTVMGGAAATSNPQLILNEPQLDYIVQGEGEMAFLNLVQCLTQKEDPRKIEGLVWLEDQKIVSNKRQQFIANLDVLPLPARHLLDIERYWQLNLSHGEATRTPWTTIVTSRGCIANCIYCSAHLMWGKIYRSRSAENVITEIEHLIKTYQIKELLIEDDNFTYDKPRLLAILDGIIERGFDLTWTTPNGIAVYTLDEKVLERIRQSGCNSLTFAIESGSQRVLSKILKKPLSLVKVRKIVRIARQLGIKTKAFYMLGIPGETKEEMEMTLDLARELKVDWSCFSITSPLPGTPLYELCLDKGYIEGITDDNISFSSPSIHTEEFDPDDVAAMWERCNAINFLENPNMVPGGNTDQAIRDFKRVLHLVPDHRLAHQALIKAYEQCGMVTDAAAQKIIAAPYLNGESER